MRNNFNKCDVMENVKKYERLRNQNELQNVCLTIFDWNAPSKILGNQDINIVAKFA